jgi:tRNA-2-methylthio-N6-dimethylallyladenosine synthase
MAEVPNICEHLHLPLQSGSDRVLSAMHRGYTADRYLERIEMARALVDDLAVTTDLIVGFPGETEDDFESTLAVCAEARFDSAYTFVYSPRPGTEAASMTAQMIDHDTAVARMDRLRAVVERSSRLANEARIGRIEELLVEGPSKRDPGLLTGRTRHNRLVHFPRPANGLRAGTYVTVQVTAARTASMTGELCEVVFEPRHRTQIPVVAV